MKKSYFSSTYKNSNDLKNSLIFIRKFKYNFISKLEHNLNLFYVESPKLAKLSNNLNLRNINFDNKWNNQVYEFIYFPCEFINKIFKKINLDNNFGLISYYERYNRDCIISSSEFIVQNVIDIRIKITNNDFINLFTQFYKKIIDTMIETCDFIIAQHNDLIINRDIFNAKYNVQNMNNFFKIYQTLKIDDYIKQKLIDNELVLFTNTKKVKTNLLFKLSEYDHDIDNAQLLYYYPISNEIINLMQIALSKNENEHYFHITINIDLIIMILLGKYHIGEVISGIWDDNFKKEAKIKKIDIL